MCRVAGSPEPQDNTEKRWWEHRNGSAWGLIQEPFYWEATAFGFNFVIKNSKTPQQALQDTLWRIHCDAAETDRGEKQKQRKRSSPWSHRGSSAGGRCLRARVIDFRAMVLHSSDADIWQDGSVKEQPVFTFSRSGGQRQKNTFWRKEKAQRPS